MKTLLTTSLIVKSILTNDKIELGIAIVLLIVCLFDYRENKVSKPIQYDKNGNKI